MYRFLLSVFCLPAICIGGLTSCATTRSALAKVREFSISDIRPAKVDVVEVREEDLKPLPTGQERLLAYHRSGRFFGWFGPANFEEPELPSQSIGAEGSLLPSLD